MSQREMSGKNSKFFRKIWFVLLLLLPTIFSALFFYVIYNNTKYSSGNIYDITFSDLEGNIIAQERNFIVEAEKDGIISLFFPITENLTARAEIPEFIDRTKGFVATVNYMNIQNKYTFYFSVEDMLGYCVFNGDSYKLLDSDTRKFLTSIFSESIYDAADIPVLYTISGEPIIPQTVWWTYAMASGDYAMANDNVVTNETIVYDMSGALGLSFSTAPSESNIKIMKDQQIVYDGSYEDISQLTFEKGDLLHISISAEWSYSQAAEYYGNITYSFDVTISDRAEFYLTENTCAVNSFLGVFCYNIKDASKIVFEAKPALPKEPEFTFSHGVAIALLPIERGTNLGEYEITLTYGAATEKFIVNVTKDIQRSYVECSIDEFTVKKAFDKTVTDEMERLKQLVYDNSSGEKLFYGEFLDYTDFGAYKYSDFGDVYNNPYRVYNTEANEYRFSNQTDVAAVALNSGRVIKTGYNDFLGNYVIVSHGCGLATWYAHLSRVDVAQGSYVLKGESLGNIGSSGLSNDENIAIFVSLSGNFINPMYVCKKQFDGK